MRFFFGIVGGYGLYTAYVITFVYGHRVISSTGPASGQSGVNPYRDCAEIVRKSCSCRAVSARKSYRAPCGDRPSHGARAGIVQCHLRHVYGLRAYEFFKAVNLLANPNRRGRAEPVNPYENLTAASCLRREASRRPHGKGDTGQDTGSVDPSQAKCKLGIQVDVLLHL